MDETETALVEEPPVPSWNLDTGDEIDDGLVVIDRLGGGTRYDVYRAWDGDLFCQVAVKVIRPHRVEDDRAMDGLEREIAIGARLNHPNLVRLLRWSMSPPRPYLVLEYITAQTVGDHLADIGAVSVPETCLLGIRMLSALHHMHVNHVLHLDVKPDNVTMGDPPRLLDLSLAQTFVGPLKLRHTMGTAAYMPPEQCDHGIATPQSDLWSIGVTLYEAVSGMRPFREGEDGAATKAEEYPQLVDDPQPIADVANVPEGLARLVMACLWKDHKKRPRSAVQAAIALQSVLEGLDVPELYAWPKGLRVQRR